MDTKRIVIRTVAKGNCTVLGYSPAKVLWVCRDTTKLAPMVERFCALWVRALERRRGAVEENMIINRVKGILGNRQDLVVIYTKH